MGPQCSKNRPGKALPDHTASRTSGDPQGASAARIPGSRESSATSFLFHTFLQCASPGIIDENKVVRPSSEEHLAGCGITGSASYEVNSFIWSDETLSMACSVSTTKATPQIAKYDLGRELPNVFLKVGQIMVTLCIKEMQKEANVGKALQESVMQTQDILNAQEHRELTRCTPGVCMLFAIVDSSKVAFVFGDTEFIAAVITADGEQKLYSFIVDEHKNCFFPGTMLPTVLTHQGQKGSFLVMCHGSVWAAQKEEVMNVLSKSTQADDVEQQIAMSLSPREVQRQGGDQVMVLRL